MISSNVIMVVASALLYSVCARTTKSHRNILYATTTFNDGHFVYKEDYGQVAAFSNTSVTHINGKIYEPDPSDPLFSCSQVSNTSLELPTGPFIVFLPLGDCPYSNAQTAAKLGAAGILFHSEATSPDLNSYQAPLKLVVGLVTLTEHELRSLRGILRFSNTTISITINQYSSLPTTTHTFYFVLFAFSILVFLSLIWFFITYIRRCCDHFVTKRRKTLAQREALKTIKKLPTKKYKKIDEKDSDSIASSDEPACAVCLDNFRHDDHIRVLPCNHEFHQECIDPWLKSKATCPLCKYHIIKGQQQPINDTTVSTLVQHSNISRQLSINSTDGSSQTPSEQDIENDRGTRQQATSVIQSNVELAILASMV